MRNIRLARWGSTLALACITTYALAQGTAAPAPADPRPAAAMPSPPAAGSTGTDRGMGTGASAKPGSIASIQKVDGVFVREAAAANKAEVALGTLAQTRASSAAVKDFGQKMVTDHTKAYDELAAIATAKGAAVPTEPTAAQKRTAASMAKLEGAAFDREFAKVMVADHKKAVALFQNEAANGRDADLKAWAGKTLPTLKEHLEMAQHLEAGVKAKK